MTGVQKYALGLSLALQKQHPEIRVLCPCGTDQTFGLNLKKSGRGGRFFWEQCWLPIFLLFHPGYRLINLCNTAPLLVKKQVVTIHDLAFRREPQWFSRPFAAWYNFMIPPICRRSQHILTVSEWIKNEIAQTYALPLQKISVVPNGLPQMDYDDTRPYPFRYLLMTGVFNPRKNADFIFSNKEALFKRNFHIVGIGDKSAIYGQSGQENHPDLHILDYVDDKTYYTLLKHADALIYPSLYEGFGIPVLEAIALGTPVIVPDIPQYRESFAGCPLYYLPGNFDDFLQKLDKIKNYNSPVQDISDVQKRYTFDVSAAGLFSVLNSLFSMPVADTKR